MIKKAKKFVKGIQLNMKQRSVAKQYEREGLTDEVFDKQVRINSMRREHGIPDPSKKIDGEYVQ